MTYPGFGSIEVDGVRFDHDVVIEAGAVRKRDKGPSKAQRGTYGHTPLTAAEAIPSSGPVLVIGTGYSGRLPIADDVRTAAASRGVELRAMPTAEACALLRTMGVDEADAILHVTC